ncbi:Protein N-methyltransferase NNT1 [Colletotrichum tanaceti]|uniref:Protein N-terminal and lysine N-methyltransferase EFM7 n=1 Tax=Colletotrichum tanaceti TaxID=1306861 RepID=A0A4U6X199_9PEZI|nr:Protein N-methyltransferase NNT1 [Colletotrichum tanaceti]TKW49148.1 Protein N-methyltransferase NNT1 [Colletotrichum tanaceti]
MRCSLLQCTALKRNHALYPQLHSYCRGKPTCKNCDTTSLITPHPSIHTPPGFSHFLEAYQEIPNRERERPLFLSFHTSLSLSQQPPHNVSATAMSPVSDVADGDTGDLFADPEDYYPPTPPPTFQTHTLSSGRVLTLHLVGYSPTEAHHLWNGSRVVSNYFEADPTRVKGRTVLELGAGAGLPSLTAGILGAKKVVVSDFPDVDIVQTMQKNVDEAGDLEGIVVPKGYVWGADVKPLLEALHEPAAATGGYEKKFDVLVLADLLFRHSEHGKLVDTIRDALVRRRDGVAYVFFTSYRPWLRHKDLAFFDVARERGFLVEQVLEEKLEKPLFEDDPGDVEVQKTVSGFEVRWPEELLEG